MDPHLKKARKDSYKVKITTFHQYEMEDCNPQHLFGNVPKNEEDVFQFFSKQSAEKDKQSNSNKAGSEAFQFDEIPSPLTPKAAFVRKQSMPEHGYVSSATSARTLEEKVRLAKEKAESVLSRYLTTKKKTVSLNQ